MAQVRTTLFSLFMALMSTIPTGFVVFNGLDNYIEMPSSSSLSISSQGFSVAVWVRPDALSFEKTEGSLPEEQYVHWLGKGEKGQQEWTFRMYSAGGPREHRVSFYVFNASGGLGCGSYFQDAIEAGRWIHVVATVDAALGQVSIYKNGIFRKTTPYLGMVTPGVGHAPLRLGTKDFESFFQGAMAQLLIWNRPLTSAEVYRLWNSDIVSTKGLVAKYLLDEQAGSVVHDSSGNGHAGVLKAGIWGTDPDPTVDGSEGISGGGC